MSKKTREQLPNRAHKVQCYVISVTSFLTTQRLELITSHISLFYTALLLLRLEVEYYIRCNIINLTARQMDEGLYQMPFMDILSGSKRFLLLIVIHFCKSQILYITFKLRLSLNDLSNFILMQITVLYRPQRPGMASVGIFY